jgi:hypothetical protein
VIITTSSLLIHQNECTAKSGKDVYENLADEQSNKSKNILESEAVRENVVENKNIQQLSRDKIKDLQSLISVLSNNLCEQRNESVNRLISSMEELTMYQKSNSDQLNNFSKIKDKLYAINQHQQCLTGQLNTKK